MKKRLLAILTTLMILMTCLAPMAAMAEGANPEDVVLILEKKPNLVYSDSQGDNTAISEEKKNITINEKFTYTPNEKEVTFNGNKAESISFQPGMKLDVEKLTDGTYKFTVTHVYIKGKIVDADNNKVSNAICKMIAKGGSAELKVSNDGEFATSVDVGENSRPDSMEVTADGYTTFAYTFTDQDLIYGKTFDGKNTIKITPDIANAEVSPIEDQAWTGSKITPMPVSVKFNGKTLKYQADYAVGYKNNTDPGVATITLTGNGSYGGTKNVTFNIVAPNVPVTGVELKPAELDLKVGESAGLTATVQPSNATDKTVTFKSSDEQVAKVSENGKVTAVAAGTATVTVTTKDGEFTGTCKITVTAPATGVELDKTVLELKAGQSEELKATVLPDGADQTVTWKSSDEKVATVSAEGKVTAVAAGEATVTVTTKDGEKTAECKITVMDDNRPSDPVDAKIWDMYSNTLGREADKTELEAWSKAIKNGELTGADIASNFIGSDEYAQRNDQTPEEQINALYEGLLGRKADEDGLKAWSKLLYNGMSIDTVAAGITSSEEFGGVCKNLGIETGAMEKTQPRDQNPKVTEFVNRFYTEALGRKADGDGLNSWAAAVLNQEATPQQIAENIIFSPEMTEKNLNDKEFVATMYQVYMGREPDEDGMQAWVKALEEGATREQVSAGFGNSAEFSGIVEGYGIGE